jgi:hypothetical protein
MSTSWGELTAAYRALLGENLDDDDPATCFNALINLAAYARESEENLESGRNLAKMIRIHVVKRYVRTGEISRPDADAWLDYIGCPHELRHVLLHAVAKDKDRTLVITPPKRHREAKQKKNKKQAEEVPAFAEEVEMVEEEPACVDVYDLLEDLDDEDSA